MSDRTRTPGEQQVTACYSTWGESYYEDYFGERAPYPPVHRDLVIRVLERAGAKTLLDAGCGPASMLRDMPPDLEIYGFDLTPEMVDEARRVLSARGLPPERIWEGSVLDRASFRPQGGSRDSFDATICIGVLPHVEEKDDEVVLRNVWSSLEPGGVAIVEARNQLFSLFTMNRYSHELFMSQLIPGAALQEQAHPDEPLRAALDEVESMFRLDEPPIRTGSAGQPGYDQVLSRSHNPLTMKQLFIDSGFEDVEVLFYHFHALPPLAGKHVPRLAREVSLAMENPTDWRGHFMASAFLLVGTRGDPD
jgi:2-polyprenyl-3-methyl-5-hydroxy-6-metoxy-1,4-benzoquinol methylase